MEKNNQYVAPEVYVVECQVEKGYANSNPTTFSFGDDVQEANTKNWWFDNE